MANIRFLDYLTNVRFCMADQTSRCKFIMVPHLVMSDIKIAPLQQVHLNQASECQATKLEHIFSKGRRTAVLASFARSLVFWRRVVMVSRQGPSFAVPSGQGPVVHPPLKGAVNMMHQPHTPVVHLPVHETQGMHAHQQGGYMRRHLHAFAAKHRTLPM